MLKIQLDTEDQCVKFYSNDTVYSLIKLIYQKNYDIMYKIKDLKKIGKINVNLENLIFLLFKNTISHLIGKNKL